MNIAVDRNLAMYVSSYDGCSDLWETYFSLLDKFWPDCGIPIYLVNNEKEFAYKRVKVINTGKEVDWFNRNINALNQINEKYIIFMLEDYFISKMINNADFDEIISFMEDNGVYYYQLSVGNTKLKLPQRVNVTAKTNYPISLQPAIWNREVFLGILKEINGKTPWDVENYFTQKYKGGKGLIEGAFHDTRDLLGYKNGVLRGKWILDTIKYYKRLGIEIGAGSREVMSGMKCFKYRIAAFTNQHIPNCIKTVVKKILKLLHFDYLK